MEQPIKPNNPYGIPNDEWDACLEDFFEKEEQHQMREINSKAEVEKDKEYRERNRAYL